MTLYGDGRAAIVDDDATAERLGWSVRRRSLPEPEIVLSPREGDPRLEPWIAPPWWRRGLAGLGRRPGRSRSWSYLPGVPGVYRYLRALAVDKPRRLSRVAVAGLGRVGGVAATVLAATEVERSRVRELLLYDVDAANQERWLLELGSIAGWRGRGTLPRVRPTTPAQAFNECDVFLFVASAGVPPLGTEGDVRNVQLEPNRAILASFLREAVAARFTGPFLIASDPVDWLSQAAFHDSNSDESGGFSGTGLAPESIAGLGLGVMWARALAEARKEGFESLVAENGAIFGPHSTEVLAFDDLRAPSKNRSDSITRAAREGNYVVRHLGFLPYVGPGVSSVAFTLPHLLAGREMLASVLVDGIYVGSPSRSDWGHYPVGRPMADEVFSQLQDLYRQLRAHATSHGLTWE